jgi:hypothetical protein
VFLSYYEAIAFGCQDLEELLMTTPPRQDDVPKNPVGRPKGAPSTIVNVRLPLALLARLDRDLDRLEVQTGRQVNRGRSARRALELFLERHEPGTPK